MYKRQVRTLAQDDKGNIWIGTINALFVLEPETEKIAKYAFSHENESSLGHNSVRSILKDNQGGMWVGTYYGGLNYYHAMAPAFETLTYSAYKNLSLIHICICDLHVRYGRRTCRLAGGRGRQSLHRKRETDSGASVFQMCIRDSPCG